MTEVERLRAFILEQKKHIDHLQYRIDELMLEYCPNEMSEEQLENYKAHQQPYLDDAIRGLGDINT